MFTSVLLIAVVILLILLLLLWKKFGGYSSLTAEGRVLLITAHPDDECMFFSPTLLALGRQQQVYLLCLTDGNYYGLGSIRRQELYKSALTLGISADRVILYSDTRLPDDPQSNWDLCVVSKVIVDIVTKHQIKMIITFDEKGVSGHPNHGAICKALRQGSAAERSQGLAPAVLLLETTNLGRKYAGLLDLPVSLVLSRYYAVCSMADYLQARKAMVCHGSQYAWFRKLYVCFSRYMIVNTFRVMK